MTHLARKQPMAVQREPVVSALLILNGLASYAEHLWVRRRSGQHYEVWSIPYFAYNLSLGDVVQCSKRRGRRWKGIARHESGPAIQRMVKRRIRVVGSARSPFGGEYLVGPEDRDWAPLFVTAVRQKSGNQTIRVACPPKRADNPAQRARLVAFLKRVRLDHEVSASGLVAINVASQAQHDRVVRYLERPAIKAALIWEDGDPQPDRTLDARESTRSPRRVTRRDSRRRR